MIILSSLYLLLVLFSPATLACLIVAQCLINTGWEICQEIINAQDLINAQAVNKTNMAYKVKKRTGWEIFL